ncbi:MAG TPA: hypothetical protein VEV87_05800 [Chitinophagaceae bacterium]|nr:hypothetical protein [Chitinophagaceae bacterium]
MRPGLVFISLIVLFSCNTNNSTTETKKDSAKADHPQEKQKGVTADSNTQGGHVLNGCYSKILDRDTFVLHIQQSNNIIKGKLTFNNFQKDKSSGNVHGTQSGDTVKLWYDFHSEGMKSVMEVYFRKQNDALVRGLGPVEVRGDSAYFNDHSKIQFSADQTFRKVDCSILPSKYH